MRWERVALVVTALGGILSGLASFTENYSLEITLRADLMEVRLVPIWGPDEKLPARLLE